MSDKSKPWVAHLDIFVDPDGAESNQEKSFAAIKILLLDKKISIQEVVSAMGKYLTTTETPIRVRGLILLGKLIAELHSAPLEFTAVQSLAKYLTVKLEDWRCVRGVLIGCAALLRRPRKIGAPEGNDVIDMAKSMLQYLQVQALGLTDRLLSLELYECLLNDHGATVFSLIVQKLSKCLRAVAKKCASKLGSCLLSLLLYRGVGSDLIGGVCAAIDKEKDPRCLLVTFHLVELLSQLFPEADGPLADWAEELFGIVSQYFPVSFNPPPNDTRGISRDDLSFALLKVFTSSPHFAPFCIPLLLEKLSSTLQRAKLDSLKYLGSAAVSFGPRLISEHFGAIWAALKYELIPTSISTPLDVKDGEVLREALVCLTKCVQASTKLSSGDENDLGSRLLTLICEDECVEDLVRFLESNTSSKDEQIHATGQMLAASVKASPTACYVCTNNILDRIVSACGAPPLDNFGIGSNGNKSDDSQLSRDSHSSAIGLRVIAKILDAASVVANDIASTSGPTMSMNRNWLQPISALAPRLILAYNQISVGRAQMGNIRVAGLHSLASFPAALSPVSEERRKDILRQLVDTLLDKREALDVHDKALDAVLAISKMEEQFGGPSSKECPVLSAVIPRFLEEVTQAQTVEHLKSILKALTAIAGPRQVAREMVLSGLSKMITVEFEKAVSQEEASEFPEMVTILGSLSQDVIPLCETGHSDQIAACEIVSNLWRIIENQPFLNQNISDSVLSSIMEINRVVLRSCSEQVQEHILSMATAALLDSERCSREQNNTSSKPGTTDVTILSPAAGCTDGNDWLTHTLAASVVIGLLPSVLSSKRDLLLKIFASNFSTTACPKPDVVDQATASILNKWTGFLKGNRANEGEVEGLDDAIRYVVDDRLMPIFSQYLSHDSGDVDNHGSRCPDEAAVVRAVYALAWVGKGLAMRGHPRVPDIAAIFLGLLQFERSRSATADASPHQTGQHGQSSDVAQAAAESIGIVVKDSSTCLNKAHNAAIRPLYKQRFFNSMLPPLQEALRTAGNLPYRIWFVRASIYLISGMPHAAVLTEGRKVFPMVLDGLSELSDHPKDSDLLLATVLTLALFLTDDSSGRSIAADFVPSMTRRLIKLTQYRFSWMTRQTALQSLAAIVGLPFARVFPEKFQVLKAVTAALDDSKRSVRKEAVRCRKVWFGR